MGYVSSPAMLQGPLVPIMPIFSAASPACSRDALRLNSSSFRPEMRYKPIYFVFPTTSQEFLLSVNCNLLIYYLFNFLLRLSNLRALTQMITSAILSFLSYNLPTSPIQKCTFSSPRLTIPSLTLYPVFSLLLAYNTPIFKFCFWYVKVALEFRNSFSFLTKRDSIIKTSVFLFD